MKVPYPPLRINFYKGRCLKVVSSHQPLETTHPCFHLVQGSGFRWRLRRMLDDGILVSSAFPKGEGAPKGRRLALEAVSSHAGMPTPPRFARLPLPEEGARMILNRASPFI